MMTKTLQNAFEEASKLPEPEQEELAAWLLEEMRSEDRWTQMLQKSQESLENLADEALSDHGDNETETLDPDNL